MSIHQAKTTRISIDVPFDLHIHLKIACAREGIPIQKFVRESIAKGLEELEMRLDVEAFDRGTKEIEEHGTISLEDFTKKMEL